MYLQITGTSSLHLAALIRLRTPIFEIGIPQTIIPIMVSGSRIIAKACSRFCDLNTVQRRKRRRESRKVS